jgi:hypothetical protein
MFDGFMSTDLVVLLIKAQLVMSGKIWLPSPKTIAFLTWGEGTIMKTSMDVSL